MPAKNEYGELVDQSLACPVCHNNIMDTLIIHDNDIVKCERCGTNYNPNTGQYKIHWRNYVLYRIKYC